MKLAVATRAQPRLTTRVARLGAAFARALKRAVVWLIGDDSDTLPRPHDLSDPDDFPDDLLDTIGIDRELVRENTRKFREDRW